MYTGLSIFLIYQRAFFNQINILVYLNYGFLNVFFISIIFIIIIFEMENINTYIPLPQNKLKCGLTSSCFE